MSEPFLAEIRIVGFTFAPRGWALCDGQILPINQHQSLYSLMGTTFGGDGRTTFGIPEMRGRTSMSPGAGFTWGQKGGQENHTLIQGETPTHTHSVTASNSPGDSNVISDKLFATTGSALYGPGTAADLTPLANTIVNDTGADQQHNNMCPYLVVNFCIAMQGLFPSRN